MHEEDQVKATEAAKEKGMSLSGYIRFLVIKESYAKGVSEPVHE
jgi:hypothetical protein